LSFVVFLCITIVNIMANKNDRIYIRITTEIKEQFEKVAEYQGLKSATLLHTLIVKSINDAKRKTPEIFQDSAKKSKKREIPVMTLEEAIADNERKQEKDKKARKTKKK
jgi:antitoxin component of RelBE/YafQ-DinJ toxin-antitoxin module